MGGGPVCLFDSILGRRGASLARLWCRKDGTEWRTPLPYRIVVSSENGKCELRVARKGESGDTVDATSMYKKHLGRRTQLRAIIVLGSQMSACFTVG